MKIVVTIPAYNEQKTIGSVIDGINSVMHKNHLSFKIIVIDDGSRDRTAAVSKERGAAVYAHNVNRGLADAFRTGMKAALALGADIIVHIDADAQYLPSEVPNIVKPIIEKKADIVLGSRFKGKIEGMPLIKRLGNMAFSHVISKITRYKISDAQTGFRAFTNKVAEIELLSDHTYTQEQIIRALKKDFRLVEVPVHFMRRKDKSRLIGNSFEYAARAWINLLRVYRDYEPIKFFGIFGSIFMVLGLFLGLLILYSFLLTGAVGGIPRVILSVLFLIMGIQVYLFGFLADMFRKG
jgi:glycosyltransferase involved in cell wall biosynthesis